MLVELMRVGAATGQLDEMVGNQFCIPPGHENQGDGLELLEVGGQMNIAKPHSIVVDQSGVRYQNECGSYVEFCKNMLRRDREVRAVPSWWIVDLYYMRTYMYCGTMPGTEKPKAWYDSGFLKLAETIEELAGLLEIEPAALRKTIDDFNANARQGRDPSFYRGDRLYDRFLGDHYASDSPTLGPIEDGPFYAAPLVPGNVGTFGGAVTDEQGRVLTEDGYIIPNLYATGTVTASVMGRCYPAGGASIGPAMLWGYLAALSAAGAPQSRKTLLSA